MSGSVITIEEREGVLLCGLLENGKLVEYYRFFPQAESLIGQIVMGKVTDPVGGLHAFIINLRKDKDGFLNAGSRSGIRCGDLLPVQIQQEGTGTKGYRVTEKYTIAGHNVVLTPFDPRTSISSKIQSEAVTGRFRGLREHFPGQDVGWIFRTDAQSASDEEILAEADALYARHLRIQQMKKTAVLGAVLDTEEEPLIAYIRSQPRGSVEKIVCDHKETVRRLQAVITEAPVEFFDQGRWSIREFYHFTGTLLDAISRKVLLKNGGSIFIDETEALTAIDVNSGGADHGRDREQTILQANLDAADEILHQIRLRNLSGILIIDFIDMKQETHRQMLLEHMKKEAKKDRQYVTVHGFTKLGLMELTRRRERLPLSSFLTKESV